MMKTSVPLPALLLFLFVLLVGGNAQAQSILAMVTDLNGTANVQDPDGRSRTAALLDYLDAGDRLIIPADGMAVISYLDPAAEWKLRGPGAWLLSANAPQTQSGATPERNGLDPRLTRPVALELNQRRSELRTAGMVMRQIGGTIDPIGPIGPNVAGNPVFEWEAKPGITEYRLRLEKSRGSILLDLPVHGNRLELPAAARLPADQRYRWQVETENGGTSARSPWTQFTTLSEEAQQRLAELRPGPKAPFSQQVLYARSLEAEGVKDEARRLWAALAQQRPELAKTLAERNR